MTAAICSKEMATDGKANQSWCICRLCVDGYGISVEFDGEEYRICGELCFVGRPINSMVESTTDTNARGTARSPLVCSICREKVDLSSASSCVSDDDDMISSDNIE